MLFLHALVTAVSGGVEVFISKNLGETWELLKTYNDSIKESNYKKNHSEWHNEAYQIASTENAVLINTEEGIFASYNYGSSWEQLNYNPNKSHLRNRSTNLLISNNHSFFIAPDIEDLEHHKTSEISVEFHLTQKGGGILRSDDDGKTWKKINTGLIDKTVTCLTASKNIVFALTPSGIFKSLNNGDEWNMLNANPEMGNIGFIKTINNILYAGTSEGMFYSEDEGATWKILNYFSFWSRGDISVLGKKIFIQDESQNIFFSKNHGNCWKNINEKTNSHTNGYKIQFLIKKGKRIIIIHI